METSGDSRVNRDDERLPNAVWVPGSNVDDHQVGGAVTGPVPSEQLSEQVGGRGQRRRRGEVQ